MTELQTFLAAIAQYPPGMVRWWCEEVLIRGRPSGGIGGVHVIIGAELTDPLGGKTRAIKGPYPLDALDVLTGQAAADWSAVLGTTLAAQQATIDERDATIATLNEDLAARQATLDAQAATIAQQAATIADLQAQLDAALAPANP